MRVPGKGEWSIKHSWANDRDEDTCHTYKRNICRNDNANSVICADVRSIDISENNPLFRDHPFDAFAFGFPCNDFSNVGEKNGLDGEYGALYSYGVKVLDKFKPKWFLAENVSGLTSANDGKAFSQIMNDMRECGYHLYPHLYKFEEYGVPQTRHRIIIIGIKDDIKKVYYPPSPKMYSDIDVSAEKALSGIPRTAPNNEPSFMTERVRERLSYIKPGENAFNAEELKKHPELQLKVKGATISQIYRRLVPDAPSYTVTGSGGGGTHIYHWKEPRALTNRERARLQTFPDDYVFMGNKEKVRRQIGMAVPVAGAKAIFEAVLKTMADVEYDHVDCNIDFKN
ncbi:DNA-cytosine methyltransferase [Anaerovibrio sp. JC8]|nr:DNA-cytosine methyltransferase [Anaerovibrio sp. JC8]